MSRAAEWTRNLTAGPVVALAWSPDGKSLATSVGGSSGTASPPHDVSIWTAAGTHTASVVGRQAVVHALAWSPDGRLLATGGEDGSVDLWTAAGVLVRTLRGTDPIFSLAWSPDGALLAAGAIHFPSGTAGGSVTLPGVIRLWRPDGRLVRTLGIERTGGKFLNLAWSPDGSVLAAGAVDYRAWRRDGTIVGELRSSGPPAWAMAWAPDGGSIAIGDENGLLSIGTPSGSGTVSARMSGGVDRATYGAGGTLLALSIGRSVEVVQATDPRTVLWSAAAPSGLAAWRPTGGELVTDSGDGLDLWSMQGSKELTLTGCPGAALAVGWSPAGQAVALLTDRGSLCAWRP